MNYSGKTIAITGANGFIGKALVNWFRKDETINLRILETDVRDPRTFLGLDHSVDYLFHFAAPSSQVLFKRMPLHCTEVTVAGFLNAAKACINNGIKLVYPSTGLLSSPQRNEYARTKEVCEQIAVDERFESLGVRIFATYGPGEHHKRDFASVPYLFARDMAAGKQPLIYGDGQQVRDFIYIDDTVQAILHLAEECSEPVVDVGYGESVSFNQIIAQINWALVGRDKGKYIKPIFVDRPPDYVNETRANVDIMNRFYKCRTSFEPGVNKVVKHLKESQI